MTIKNSAGAPELELLRHRFGRVTRQVKEEFAQPEGMIDLLIRQDYTKWFPTVRGQSKESKDDLYFLKTCLLPRGIIYGEAADGLTKERRELCKRTSKVSRESSGASTCREPDGDEKGEKDQALEEDMIALFRSPISSSSSDESSCSVGPYDIEQERKKWKPKTTAKPRRRSLSRSEDRNGTMSEAEQQQEQQPRPSTSKMSNLESMAAERDRLTRKLKEQDELMKQEEERILKEAEEDKKRQRAKDKKEKEEKDRKEQEEKVRKQRRTLTRNTRNT
jgi:hypothetical protein